MADTDKQFDVGGALENFIRYAKPFHADDTVTVSELFALFFLLSTRAGNFNSQQSSDATREFCDRLTLFMMCVYTIGRRRALAETKDAAAADATPHEQLMIKAIDEIEEWLRKNAGRGDV